jgi:hypothetical protein
MKYFKHHARASRPRSVAMSTIALLVLGVVGFALGFAGSAGSATTLNLGAAASFGAISATAMTGAGGNTVVNGDVGSPTSVDATVTNPGFARFDSPALAAGMVGPMNAVTAAFGAAAAQASTGDVTGNLGGTVTPGVYDSTSAILVNSPLTLDAQGDPNAVFIFRAVSDLTFATGATINLIGNANPCNIFWKVNSAFLTAPNSTFVGTILALTQITLVADITVSGRLFAQTADVTFIHDTVNSPGACAAAAGTTTATTATPPATTVTTTTTSAATTTTVATTPVTTTPGATTPVTSTPGATTPVTSTPGATTPHTTTPHTTTPVTTSTPATTSTPTTTTTPAQAKAAKAARAKALKQRRTRGNARPPLHRFGLTG